MSSASNPGVLGPAGPAPGSGGVRLNATVPERVKESFERAVRENYGETMAAAILQMELTAELGEGPVTALREEIDELLDTVGLPGRETSSGGPDIDSAGTADVAYHIDQRIKQRLKAMADQDAIRSASDLVTKIMWRYARGEGALARAGEAVSRARQTAEEQLDTETGKTQRVPKIIAAGLRQRADGDLTSFTVDDFDAVIRDTDALKFGATRHIRETHLPDVLEQLGFTWDPADPQRFVDEAAADLPETRDPRTKPTYLTESGDRALAVRAAGYEAVRETSRAGVKLHTADAVADVESLSNAIAAEHMRAAAEAPGFEYDGDERVLKVNQRAVEAAAANDAVREIVTAGAGRDERDQTEAGAGDVDGEPDWLETVVDHFAGDETVPDAAVKTKVAKEKYPGEIDEETDTIPNRVRDRVTDDEVWQVREGLAQDGDDEASAGEGETADDLTADADERLEALNAGHPDRD